MEKENLYDAIIVGGGVAGLTGAVYLARAKYSVLVIEKEHFGGQITITDEVVNYPGIQRISGAELGESMRRQAQAFGAELTVAQALKLNEEGDVQAVETDKGVFKALAVLIATGAKPVEIGFKGEEEHKGRGVAYCATCDGEFFSGKEIFVIGGGFAAAEESVFLTKFARHVTILVREEDFTCAASVAQKAREHEKITVITNTVVQEVSGDGKVDFIRYKNTKTGEETEYRAQRGDSFGVFVFAGYSPETNLVKNLVKLNEQGYIVTNSHQETSLKGVFAAGDVCIKALRQVVTATGDAALAATEMEKYISGVREKTGLRGKAVSENGEKTELFDENMQSQLKEAFGRMKSKVILKAYKTKSELSEGLEQFVKKLADLGDMLSVEIVEEEHVKEAYVEILTKNGERVGLEFHGIPTGHEFTPFVLALCNVGEPLGRKMKEKF